jgi:hypothetical protein
MSLRAKTAIVHARARQFMTKPTARVSSFKLQPKDKAGARRLFLQLAACSSLLVAEVSL